MKNDTLKSVDHLLQILDANVILIYDNSLQFIDSRHFVSRIIYHSNSYPFFETYNLSTQLYNQNK
jgi:hypothetical protein